jgi:hypothetical protein
MLDAGEASVKGALQRARATLGVVRRLDHERQGHAATDLSRPR